MDYTNIFRGEVIFTNKEIKLSKLTLYDLIKLHMKYVERENGFKENELGWYHMRSDKGEVRFYFCRNQDSVFSDKHRALLQTLEK